MARRICIEAVLSLLMLAFTGAAAAFAADEFPTKPIRIVVPAAPGGALDLTTRLVAQKMADYLKQTVIVDNRAGADTLIGTRYVKDAAPDGYTIVSVANGFSTMPALKLEPGYDPLKDFAPIGIMITSPMQLEISTTKPDKTLQEFIARAKANPGTMNYGSAGVGSPPHIFAAAFLQTAGLKFTHVPYKGNGAALPDIAGGRIDMIFDGYISSLPYLKGAKLRALATSGTERLSVMPDVPTFKELGVDYTETLWLGLLAPAATPKDIVQRLSDALHHATTDNELAARFASEGSHPETDSPDEFRAFLVKDVKDGTALVESLNIPKQ